VHVHPPLMKSLRPASVSETGRIVCMQQMERTLSQSSDQWVVCLLGFPLGHCPAMARLKTRSHPGRSHPGWGGVVVWGVYVVGCKQ
jgi:hypothetical protein